jgi:hypothetical protein
MLTVRQYIDTSGKAAVALPDETHRSLPVPSGPAGKATIAFLFCPEAYGEDMKLLLTTPEYVAYLAVDDGHVLRMQAVTPADFGLRHAPGQVIGGWGVEAIEGTPEQIGEMWQRLLSLYEVILPAFVRSNGAVTNEVRQAAREFRTLFMRIAEQPLIPYYRALGKAFFAWLDLLSL